jgi:hydrogenase maturation protease
VTITIVGVGNRLRGDDAAGIEAVRRARPLVPDAVRVLERDGEPAGLIDAWSGADQVVVVDAVSAGGAPGMVHRLDASEAALPARLFGASTHELGVAQAIELSRALGTLPSKVIVLGIEGADFDARDGLSPAVERGVDAAVRVVVEEVASSTSGH